VSQKTSQRNLSEMRQIDKMRIDFMKDKLHLQNLLTRKQNFNLSESQIKEHIKVDFFSEFEGLELGIRKAIDFKISQIQTEANAHITHLDTQLSLIKSKLNQLYCLDAKQISISSLDPDYVIKALSVNKLDPQQLYDSICAHFGNNFFVDQFPQAPKQVIVAEELGFKNTDPTMLNYQLSIEIKHLKMKVSDLYGTVYTLTGEIEQVKMAEH